MSFRADVARLLRLNVDPKLHPKNEYGFWWWYDPARKDWFIGTNPQIQKPSWAA